MTIASLSIFSIITYVIWKTYTTLSRLVIDMIKDKNINMTSIIEIIYTFLMIYLLINASKLFLVLATIIFIVHVSIGMFVEIFHPELHQSKDMGRSVIINYWLYVIIDATLTIISYAIVSIQSTL